MNPAPVTDFTYGRGDRQARTFTFADFTRLTPDLAGQEEERRAVFDALPGALQRQASGRCTPPPHKPVPEVPSDREVEIDARARLLAFDWLRELCHEPPRGGLVPRHHIAAKSYDDDSLLNIAPPTYVEALTGIEVPRNGMIRCPFHADGQERTPSCKVYDDTDRGWYCFACARGGTIYDFAGEMWGYHTRGRAFVELRRRINETLLRWVTA